MCGAFYVDELSQTTIRLSSVVVSIFISYSVSLFCPHTTKESMSLFPTPFNSRYKPGVLKKGSILVLLFFGNHIVSRCWLAARACINKKVGWQENLLTLIQRFNIGSISFLHHFSNVCSATTEGIRSWCSPKEHVQHSQPDDKKSWSCRLKI